MVIWRRSGSVLCCPFLHRQLTRHGGALVVEVVRAKTAQFFRLFFLSFLQHITTEQWNVRQYRRSDFLCLCDVDFESVFIKITLL